MQEAGTQLRLGILGGSFNPVHLGHLIMAQDALELFDLAKVLFIPCAQPPHKPRMALVPGEHRLAMLEAAIEGELSFEVSDIELRRQGVSYTVDTLRELATLYPGVELCFIIGTDSLAELHLWRDVEALLSLCRVLTIARPGTDPATWGACLPGPWRDRLLADVRVGHSLAVSSTDIRRRVAEGLSIRYLVPPAVEMYITEHSLYRS